MKKIGFLLVCFFFLGLVSIKASFTATKSQKSSSAYAHYIMGVMHDRLSNIKEAIKEYKQAAEFDYKSIDIHLRLGIDYIKLNRLREAIEEFKLIVGIDHEFAEAQIILAMLHTCVNELKEAAKIYEELLKKASQKDPKNVEVLDSLGQIYYQEKKIDDAIATYKLILEISPHERYHFILGSLYQEKKMPDIAIKEFKKTLEIFPDYPDALNSLGYLYAQENKNLDEAEILIKKALEIDPDNAAYLDSLGWVYFKKQNLDLAITYLQKALDNLTDPVIYDHLGDTYLKKNMPEKAKQMWQRSLELNPEQKSIKEKIKNIR
ncbi:MAG: tetratricopeptide repeat protein [Candidatus Omnitrophota bacterium]